MSEFLYEIGENNTSQLQLYNQSSYLIRIVAGGYYATALYHWTFQSYIK